MSEAVDAFDKVAFSYDAWYETEKGRQVLSSERRIVAGFLPNDGIGLEIGAGTGVFAEALTNSRRSVVCLDLSHKMLARAAGRGLPCVLGSAEAMPLRSRTLGFAYMVTVIEFLEDPVVSLKEASRVTFRNAPIVTLFINRESDWGELYIAIAEKGDPIFSHAHLYTLDEVEEIARRAGLKLGRALGTLTESPTSSEAGDKLIEPSRETGVIAVKLAKSFA